MSEPFPLPPDDEKVTINPPAGSKPVPDELADIRARLAAVENRLADIIDGRIRIY